MSGSRAAILSALAALLTPDAQNNLLLGQSPAQFDNSLKLATTASVTAAGFQFGGEYQITGSVSIPLSAIGSLAVFNPSAAATATLPAVSSVPAGKTITFFNVTNNLCTVAPAGTDVIGVNAGTVTSIKLGNGDTLTLESNGAGWRSIGGTATLGNAAAFGASKSGSGYAKLPSGIIINWTSITASTGWYTGWPLAFPTQCVAVVATNADTGASFCTTYNASTSGTYGNRFNTAGAGVSGFTFLIAIGY
jgi:hypothetical protein